MSNSGVLQFKAVKFARESGTDFATFFLLSPHPTSDVYGYFEKEGLINFSFVLEDNELDEEKDIQYTIKLLYNRLKIFPRSFYRLTTRNYYTATRGEI